MKAAQQRLHLTAFGAVRGGHLPNLVPGMIIVSFKSAAGEPNRWAAQTANSMGENMEFDELSQRALSIRKLIQQYEEQSYGTSWTNEELALGFVGDVGDLVKLVMAQNGRRNIPEAESKLAHELGDCLWSIIVLADGHGVDLEKAFLKTMDDLENHFQKGPVVG